MRLVCATMISMSINCWKSSDTLLMRKKNPRRPKPVLLPLGMKRLQHIEWPGHAALLALGQSWITEDHLADLMVACQIAIDLTPSDDPLHQSAELRDHLGPIIQWIVTQPNRLIHDVAIKRLKEINEPKRLS